MRQPQRIIALLLTTVCAGLAPFAAAVQAQDDAGEDEVETPSPETDGSVGESSADASEEDNLDHEGENLVEQDEYFEERYYEEILHPEGKMHMSGPGVSAGFGNHYGGWGVALEGFVRLDRAGYWMTRLSVAGSLFGDAEDDEAAEMAGWAVTPLSLWWGVYRAKLFGEVGWGMIGRDTRNKCRFTGDFESSTGTNVCETEQRKLYGPSARFGWGFIGKSGWYLHHSLGGGWAYSSYRDDWVNAFDMSLGLGYKFR